MQSLQDNFEDRMNVHMDSMMQPLLFSQLYNITSDSFIS